MLWETSNLDEEKEREPGIEVGRLDGRMASIALIVLSASLLSQCLTQEYKWVPMNSQRNLIMTKILDAGDAGKEERAAFDTRAHC